MNEKNIVIAVCSIWNEENKMDGPSGLGTMGLGRFKLDSTPIRHKVLQQLSQDVFKLSYYNRLT